MQVKIENFEGPLDLLLQLIEKQEMDITRVSLASIAEQYVDYIKNSPDIKPEEIGDFLVVAGKLLFLKSKILLPYCEGEEEEDDSEELEQQLKIYKEFLEASKKIDTIAKQKQFTFAPHISKRNRTGTVGGEEPLFSPPSKLTSRDLESTYKRLLKDLRNSELLKEKMEEDKIDKRINLEDKIESIRNMVARKIKFSFDKITRNAQNKTEVIVSFLAVLELTKQKVIITDQQELFSTINIDPNNYEQE